MFESTPILELFQTYAFDIYVIAVFEYTRVSNIMLIQSLPNSKLTSVIKDILE